MFCESCGVSLPKFVRAAVKEPEKAPEVPSATAVSGTPARRRGVPRTVILVLVITAIVLLIAALFLTGGIGGEGSTPEAVATEFLSSWASWNFTRARELSTGTTMTTINNTAEIKLMNIKAAYPSVSYKVSITSITTISKTDTEITLHISDIESISNAGQYNSVKEYQGNFYLTKVDGKWKISNLIVLA